MEANQPTMGSESAAQVVLKLSASQSSRDPVILPQRRISLTREKNTITIGRASRSPTKGFVPAVDNAWFHSAIMSRMQARISAKVDQKKIEIIDLGSMHGTFLNGDDRISTKEPRELKDGDVLRFGVPIFHGNEEFRPTEVKVSIEFPDRERSTTGTFQVPDGSDDESSDHDEPSDSDEAVMEIDKPGPPAWKDATAGNCPVIDLTNDHGYRQPRVLIDLSSPTISSSAPILIRDDANDSRRPVDVADSSLRSVSPAQPTTDGLADGQVPRDSDHVSYIDYSEDPCFEERMSLFSGEDERDDDDYDTPSHVDYPSGDEDDYHSSDGDDLSEQEEDSPDADGQSRSQVDELEPEDHESAMDDSEDVSEAMYTSDGDSLNVDSFNDYPSTARDDLPQEFPEVERLINSLTHPIVPRPEPTELAPRNAATVSIMGLLNHEEHPASSCSSSEKTSAEILGSKTGKVDFFLAREHNKSTLEAQKATADHVAAATNAGLDAPRPLNSGFGPAGEQAVRSPQDHSAINNDICAVCAGLAPVFARPAEVSSDQANVRLGTGDFHPPTNPPKTSPISAGVEAEGSPRRTHVGISDIVDTDQQSPGKGKRKAGDISDTSHEEELWDAASKNTESTSLTTPADGETNNVDQATISVRAPTPIQAPVDEKQPSQPAEPANESHVFAASSISERSVKRARLMRVAERLGYAALGGVTAGAMIMGTLIYTAPTFS